MFMHAYRPNTAEASLIVADYQSTNEGLEMYTHTCYLCTSHLIALKHSNIEIRYKCDSYVLEIQKFNFLITYTHGDNKLVIQDGHLQYL